MSKKAKYYLSGGQRAGKSARMEELFKIMRFYGVPVVMIKKDD